MAQEAGRLAGLGLSAREIALRLEVNKSTVTRWMKAGKLARITPRTVQTPRGRTPAQWAEAVRETYSLDATDDQLVVLAEGALTLSRNPNEASNIRMLAAGRFQALVRQLAFGATPAAAEKPDAPVAAPKRREPPRMIRRPGGDPRQLLMAVK